MAFFERLLKKKTPPPADPGAGNITQEEQMETAELSTALLALMENVTDLNRGYLAKMQELVDRPEPTGITQENLQAHIALYDEIIALNKDAMARITPLADNFETLVNKHAALLERQPKLMERVTSIRETIQRIRGNFESDRRRNDRSRASAAKLLQETTDRIASILGTIWSKTNDAQAFRQLAQTAVEEQLCTPQDVEQYLSFVTAKEQDFN